MLIWVEFIDLNECELSVNRKKWKIGKARACNFPEYRDAGMKIYSSKKIVFERFFLPFHFIFDQEKKLCRYKIKTNMYFSNDNIFSQQKEKNVFLILNFVIAWNTYTGEGSIQLTSSLR